MASTQHQETGTDHAGLAPRLQRNLERNVAALRQHRTQLFRAISEFPWNSAGRFRIEPLDGVPTILQNVSDDTTREHWSPLRLSPQRGADAIAPYRQALSAPTAKTLCGLGDGQILQWLARNAPKQSHTGAGTVYLLEPDLELVIHCLMLHNLSGPGGPIEQRRFQWFVGPSWQTAATQALLDEPMLPNSGCVIGQGVDAPAITAFWKQLTARREAAYSADCAAVREHALSLNADVLTRVFSPDPPRQPRVLLMTSKHTTVLQYSTNDAADAFAQLGWDTRILVEREDHHVVGKEAVMRAAATFKPDLLFTIDHLRHEVNDLPEQLPFICWIQDNLPNLTSQRAGQRIGRREFVIGSWVENYVQRHGYPRNQCLTMRRLTRPLDALPSDGEGEDLVYVSNHSDQPAERLTTMLQQRGAPNLPDGASLVRTAGQHMVDHYESEKCLRESSDVRRLLTGAMPQLDVDTVHVLAKYLEELNTLLYRQQALRWAAEIAEQHGLSLGIYGKGWERHPRFKRFARGVIAYGEPLQQLTYRSKINLQLEPFAPTHHQRLLDGLAAGGFFLSRKRRPEDRAFRVWLELADTIDPSIATMEDARAALDETTLSKLDDIQTLLDTHRPDRSVQDIISWLRGPNQRSRFEAMRAAPLPPRYEDIAFLDRSELQMRITKYLSDAPLRKTIAMQQRDFVQREFSYAGGISDITSRIRNRLAEDAEATGTG